MPPRFMGDHKTHDGACCCSASSLCGPELESLRDRYTQAFHGVMDTHLMTGQVCQAQCISSKETQRFWISIRGRGVMTLYCLPTVYIQVQGANVCQQAGGLSTSSLVLVFAPGI